MDVIFKKTVFLLVVILAIFACTDGEGEYNGKNHLRLEVSANFIKLVDDSSNVAGNIELSANARQVNLRWNLPPCCNLDTTAAAVSLVNGKATLPLKWDKKLENGTYGPMQSAYEGGVLISTENEAKYVKLYWVEKLDSAAVLNNPQVVTRAGDALPRAVSLTLYPTGNVIMNQVTGGGVYVDFTDVPSINVEATDVTSETNVDIATIPLLMRTPGEVYFKWTAAGAPKFDFVRNVRFRASEEVYADATLNYRVPSSTVIYKFVSSSPRNGGILDSQNANITIVVNTNKEWSLESSVDAFPPTNDPSAFGPEDKRLKMLITDNPNRESREVTVYVKSQGVVKDTLTFTQMGTAPLGIFELISTVPVAGTTIPATETNVDVTVKTDRSWYIDCDVCVPLFFDVTGGVVTETKTFKIPANPNVDNRIVTLTVGNNNPDMAKKIQFIQLGTGGANPGEPLQFLNVELPEKLPATASIYIFNFKGTYTGPIQIRSKSGAKVLYTATAYTFPAQQPRGRVPVNTGAEREITFEYSTGNGTWNLLPAETNRLQEGVGSGTGTVIVGTMTPVGNISEYGESCSCEFTGNFTGTILMRARVKGTTTQLGAEVSGSINTTLSVNIPQLQGANRDITFEYSRDGGETWLIIEDKKQVNETLMTGTLQPVTTLIPAAGKTFTWSYSGTYSKKLIVEMATVNVETGEYTVIETQSSMAPKTFTFVAPPNPYTIQRSIGFRYYVEGLDKWYIIVVMPQEAIN